MTILLHPGNKASLLPRKKAERIFSIHILPAWDSATAIKSGTFRKPGGCLWGALRMIISHSFQAHMLSIHPKTADHRKREDGEFGVGQERKRKKSMGNFKGLRSQGQCSDNKEAGRNLLDSTCWVFAFLIYPINSTHQRGRMGKRGKFALGQEGHMTGMIFWASVPHFNQAFMILYTFMLEFLIRFFLIKGSAENHDSHSYWALGIGSWAIRSPTL